MELLIKKMCYVQNKRKRSKLKTKSLKPKLLKTLNMNQFEVGPLFNRWFVETSLFVDGRSVGTELLHHQIINQQNVGIWIFWWQMFFNKFLHCFIWSSNQLLNLNIFSFLFLQTFSFINLISLCFDHWIFCHSLTNWPD